MAYSAAIVSDSVTTLPFVFLLMPFRFLLKMYRFQSVGEVFCTCSLSCNLTEITNPETIHMKMEQTNKNLPLFGRHVERSNSLPFEVAICSRESFTHALYIVLPDPIKDLMYTIYS